VKVETAALEGPALDWAVAKCEGLLCFGYRTDGERFSIENSDGEVGEFTPSTNWAEAGPIIEREKISLLDQSTQTDWVTPPLIWFAAVGDISDDEVLGYRGPTPLVAAMRCFVASRLGDEIEVPDELMAQVESPNEQPTGLDQRPRARG
jgi:hypothetical protein